MKSLDDLGLSILKFVQENKLVWSDELRVAWEKAYRDMRLYETTILDQAFKDQKDAERYMHLKWIITDKSIEEWLLLGKTSKQIDQMMDDRIRSYDE